MLLGLIPYTTPNMLLAFKPNEFFNELEKITGAPAASHRAAYYRARTTGLISDDGRTLSLSLKARQTVQPFVAAALDNAELMVIFDVPESRAGSRRKLRKILLYLGFTQIQRSVWSSSYDHRDIIQETVVDLELTDYVQIYASVRIA